MAETKVQEQHAERLDNVEDDMGVLKTDVGVLKSDVHTLNRGQVSLQKSQDRGFNEIKEAIITRDSAPPKLSIGMLTTLLGAVGFMIVTGVGGFWVVVQLLYAPLKEDLIEHKGIHPSAASLALLEERTSQNRRSIDTAERLSQDRDRAQEVTLESLSDSIDALHHNELLAAEEKGRQQTFDEWELKWLAELEIQQQIIRRDLGDHRATNAGARARIEMMERVLASHSAEGDHPFGVMASQSLLRGKLESLQSQVGRMDVGARHTHGLDSD